MQPSINFLPTFFIVVSKKENLNLNIGTQVNRAGMEKKRGKYRVALLNAQRDDRKP